MIFVRVKEVPAELKKGEYSIESPNYTDIVEACAGKRPRNNLMSINYLRELVSYVGEKYLPPEFNALTDVNVSNFKNRPCSTIEEANEILIALFKSAYPKALDAFVEHKIKNRPNGTNTIYFLGGGSYASVFLKHGIQEVLFKDFKNKDEPKKVVGKPAVKKEKADSNIMV